MLVIRGLSYQSVLIRKSVTEDVAVYDLSLKRQGNGLITTKQFVLKCNTQEKGAERVQAMKPLVLVLETLLKSSTESSISVPIKAFYDVVKAFNGVYGEDSFIFVAS